MCWLFRRRETQASPRLPHAYPLAEAFACANCGGTDVPEAGDWDPPICEECDAAINFDAELESMDERDD